MNTAVNTYEFLPQGRQETAVSGLSSLVGEIDEQAVDRILSTSSSMLPALHGYETARMLETLLTNLDGMVYRCRDDQHWTMELISQGCYRLTGYQPDELLMNKSISYETITDPEDRTLVRDTINEALGAQRPFDIEYRIRHADGEIRWVWERGVGVKDSLGNLLGIEGIIQDITDRKQAFQALREAERRYRSLFDNAIEGIFRTTPEGQYLDANPALARIYGYETVADLARSLCDIRAQLYVDPERRTEFMRIIKARGLISGFESQVYRKDGQIIWISENARSVTDEHGVVQHYEGTVEDITERKLYEKRIEQQANYDTLTGLANRSLLNDRLQQSIMTAALYGTRLAVIFVDLDRFKYINDSLGHHVGDQLLCEMSRRLSSCVREGDTVSRLGGDEFVLLLNGLGEVDAVASLMERLLDEITLPWITQSGQFDVTSSIGIALYPDDGSDAQTLLKHADSAMYRAKELGRNNFQFFTEELNAMMTERLELETGLRRALERNQFCLYYQPRVDIRTGAITGAEALLRWRVSDQEMMHPGKFIPVAEETGLIVPIGEWALREACQQNLAWQQAGLSPLVVAVNVSLRQFQRDDFLQTVSSVLQQTGLAAAALELEVTESSVMHNAERLIDMLSNIRALGVHISVDDFGTGYSSLSYLKRFPVDRLKIDRSFVQDILVDKDSEAIVRTIIALGHNLGLKLVAEGVENAEQVAYLLANGCDELQGFYYGRPMPAHEFELLLRRNCLAKPD
jgi:diguanylate cyclase (GGDEF)-like protein/PAS domain S-box-containing protein